MDKKYNRYYLYHKHVVGEGIANEQYIPDLGPVYTYRAGLRRGRGQYFIRRRGLGLASFFSSLLQRATPLLRNIGSHAVDVVSNIAKDALQGENIKESAIKNIKKAVTPTINKILNPQTETEKTPTKRKQPIVSSAIKRKKVTFRPSASFTALKKIG